MQSSPADTGVDGSKLYSVVDAVEPVPAIDGTWEVDDSASDWSTDSDDDFLNEANIQRLQQPETVTVKSVPKTIHEVVVPENAVAKVDFQRVPESEQLVKCGSLLNKVGTTFIAIGEVNESNTALDEGTIICLENRSVVGRIEEVFGPVVKPHYIIRFGCVVDSKYENSDQAEGSAASVKAAGTDESVSATTEDVLKEEVLIEQKNSDYTKMLEELDMPEGTALYAVVGTIKYVVESKCRVKGSDASNLYNEEPTVQEDFSDDEEEQKYKQLRKYMRQGLSESEARAKVESDAERKRQLRPGNKRRASTRDFQRRESRGHVSSSRGSSNAQHQRSNTRRAAPVNTHAFVPEQRGHPYRHNPHAAPYFAASSGSGPVLQVHSYQTGGAFNPEHVGHGVRRGPHPPPPPGQPYSAHTTAAAMRYQAAPPQPAMTGILRQDPRLQYYGAPAPHSFHSGFRGHDPYAHGPRGYPQVPNHAMRSRQMPNPPSMYGAHDNRHYQQPNGPTPRPQMSHIHPPPPPHQSAHDSHAFQHNPHNTKPHGGFPKQ